jgi:hypothetical protein
VRRREAEGAAHVLFEHIRRTRFELERNAPAVSPAGPVKTRRK